MRLASLLRGCALLLLVPSTALSAGVTRQESAGTRPGTPPDSLHLLEVYETARLQSARLQAARATVAASRARESAAGVPPDPLLEIGAMNLSLPGLRADMAASMAPSLQLTQTVPFPGKLSLESRLAQQATAIEGAAERAGWWKLRVELAMAFYELYESDRAIVTSSESLGLMREMEIQARSLYAAGTGQQADILRAAVEVARGRAELTRLEARRRTALARLRGLAGLPRERGATSPVLPPLPLDLPALSTLLEWAAESAPMLQGSRASLERAATRRTLAHRELWPDFTVGLQYGQARGPDGTERMGGVAVGFSVPVFAGRRQLRARDEAAAFEEATRAELAAEEMLLEAYLDELLTVLEESRTLIVLYQDEILPQAEANVASAVAAYRAGTVDFLTLIEARKGQNDHRRELHTLIARYGTLIAELESTIGRELAATGQTLGGAS